MVPEPNCVVLKPLALYPHLPGMGKRNMVVKLTKKKISYIIRAKTRNDSNKNIAVDMKICKSTVKRVWTHLLKHHEPIPLKKFGRKKKVTDEKSGKLIIEIKKEQKEGRIYLLLTSAAINSAPTAKSSSKAGAFSVAAGVVVAAGVAVAAGPIAERAQLARAVLSAPLSWWHL